MRLPLIVEYAKGSQSGEYDAEQIQSRDRSETYEGEDAEGTEGEKMDGRVEDGERGGRGGRRRTIKEREGG